MSADITREVAAMAAMAAPDTLELGEHQMRPLTATSAALCSLCGNRAYAACTGDAVQLADLNDYDLLEFLWIHVAPLPEVRRVVMAGTELKARVLEWGETLDFGVLVGARQALEFVKKQLEALDVEIAPKPPIAGAKKDQPPPNS